MISSIVDSSLTNYNIITTFILNVNFFLIFKVQEKNLF